MEATITTAKAKHNLNSLKDMVLAGNWSLHEFKHQPDDRTEAVTAILFKHEQERIATRESHALEVITFGNCVAMAFTSESAVGMIEGLELVNRALDEGFDAGIIDDDERAIQCVCVYPKVD